MLPAMIPVALAIAQAAAPALVPALTESFTGSAKAGAVAAAVVDAAMQATGTDTPAAARDAMLADPAATEAVRLALIDIERAEIEALTERLRIDAADRDSARRREVDTKDPTPSRLAYLIFGAFMAYAFTILVSAVLGLAGIKEPLVAGLVGTGFGALGSEAARIGNYYFGSSAGSAAKQRTLDSLRGG
ncbi:hypothetical protein [Arenibaculum pallidiluteum]|uniref:hypothetical protein n=1 Tax=Arenibaculum pallidiluteum TaxID=2812559 RepID=UPI001A972095|nr:hypothetical protein [Arenibaculum pallidiluteum]